MRLPVRRVLAEVMRNVAPQVSARSWGRYDSDLSNQLGRQGWWRAEVAKARASEAGGRWKSQH